MHSFSRLSNSPLYVCITTSLSIHLLMDVINSAAMNTGVYVSLSIMVFSECMPSSGIVRSYSNSISRFLRNLHTVLHGGWVNLYSHQQCKGVPFPPHSLQHLLFMDIFDDGHSDQC